jgi:prepilin-type N-terminal cleavage/methylation domain-containing protein
MRRSPTGLTLLEVMVAVAVLAIGVTSLQKLVSTGVGTIATDARLTRTMLRAQALLAEAGVRTPEVGHVSGEEAGPPVLHWERDVTPTGHAALREVRVRVWTDAGRRDAGELVEVMRVSSR